MSNTYIAMHPWQTKTHAMSGIVPKPASSAFAVLSATVRWTLEAREMGEPFNRNREPHVERWFELSACAAAK